MQGNSEVRDSMFSSPPTTPLQRGIS